MTQAEGRLLRHLVVAVVVKLAILAMLWWAFVHGASIRVDAESAAARIGAAAPPAGVSP